MVARSAWPIQVWMLTTSMPFAAQSVPNVWRRSWKTMGSVFSRSPSEAGRLERGVEGISHRVVAQVAADSGAEDEVIRAGEVLASAHCGSTASACRTAIRLSERPA